MRRAHLGLGVLACSWTLVATQPDSQNFVSIDGYPFGPGARQLTARVKLTPGENSGNTQVWVLYSTDRSQVASGQIGGQLPQGQAKPGTVDNNGVMTVTFIFPHTDHPKPNSADVNAHVYPSGSHLFYNLVKKQGTNQFASDIVDFTLPDKLTIALLGDSYSSGEGAPYSTDPKWDSDICHRSNNSGQARAVAQAKSEMPELAIAFKNVACSGAGIFDGIGEPQEKAHFFQDAQLAPTVPPQIFQVADWLNQNHYERLNIAVFSIGGNDIGFGPLVEDYFLAPQNITDPGQAQERQRVAQNINTFLPDRYDYLKEHFDAAFDYDAVLVTEYPDPTRDKNGQFCGADPLSYGGCWGPVELTNGKPEFEFAYNNVLTAMNNMIKSKVQSFPRWTFVTGLMAASRLHGLCNCDQPYFNTIGDSFLEQADPYGTMHPNRTGFKQIYQPIVYAELQKAIARIRTDNARARAIEVAREHSARKAEMVRLKAALAARPAVPHVFPPIRPLNSLALKQGADQAKKSRRVAVGDDNRMKADMEKDAAP